MNGKNQNKHLMKLKNIRQESGNPFKVMIVSGQNPRWYGGPLTSYACFWKPMHTNAAGIYWYMFKNTTDSTLSKLEQRNTFCFKDFTQRTTSLVARWQAFAQQHFSNNTLCKKHDSRMVFKKNAVQILSRKFCKWQRCLEFVAVTFFLSFSFRCFNTDLFIILP